MSDLFSLKNKKTLILEELQSAMNRTAVGAARNSLKIKDISRQTSQLNSNIEKVFQETTDLKKSIGQIKQVINRFVG